MAVTLSIRPEFPEFDVYQALSWIKTEADWVGLRFVQEQTYQRSVRNQHPQNNSITLERGVMIEAMIDGHIAYAGSSDLTQQGLLQSVRRAAQLARIGASCNVFKFSEKHRPRVQGSFVSRYRESFDLQTLGEFTDQLISFSRHLQVSDKETSNE